MPDNRTAPLTSVLIDGTVPDYQQCVPDTSQTDIAPCLLCYASASGAANAITLAGAAHGDAVATETSLGIIEIQKSRANTADDYDTSTAYAAIGTLGCDCLVHWLHVGDRIWVKGSSLTATLDGVFIPAASGLVAAPAGTNTVDIQTHRFKPIKAGSSLTYAQVEYMGIGGIDNSS